MALVDAGDCDREAGLQEEAEHTDDQALLSEIITSHGEDAAKRRLPIQFTPVSSKNLFELRSLNSTLFPMSYQDKYYKEVLAADSLARIVTWNGRAVATFSCRIQAFYDGDKPRLECYIMTFGVLALYRRLRIGALMLQSIIRYYRRKPEIRRITLHVHTVNEPALKFYQQHGFESLLIVPNYYKRLDPPTAHLLSLLL